MKKTNRPSIKIQFGKYKGRTIATVPKWYLRWAYIAADSLTEDERYVISLYIGVEYTPRKKPKEVTF